MLFSSKIAARRMASRMEGLCQAEARLLRISKLTAHRNAIACEIRTFDTVIPRSVVPLQVHGCDVHGGENCVIHSILAQQNGIDDRDSLASNNKPLVLLHGYMNGGVYFYRNLPGLSRYFASIHALDILGWGLSSRPSFLLKDNSIQTAEAFFVESLEAWRMENNIDSMVLAGHSMGGYVSVAYCEKYPEHVDRLILVSPVGVSAESDAEKRLRIAKRSTTLRSRIVYGVYSHFFDHATVGDLLRILFEKHGRVPIRTYVTNRISHILSHADERQAIEHYLYFNNTLPGSGEYCARKFLTPELFGRSPLLHRIPYLSVKSVGFLYGEHDHMPVTAGLQVERVCAERKARGKRCPEVDVYRVSSAGHQVMLENWEETQAS